MTPFLRSWGAPALAGGLAIGAGLGFWLWIDAVTDENREQARKIVALEGVIETKEKESGEDATTIAVLTERLSNEQMLSAERLQLEQDRRTASESRNQRMERSIRDLRTEIEGRGCGIGVPLTNSLRDSWTERETERQSRERSITGVGKDNLSPGRGFDETDGTGTETASTP